MFEKSRLNQVGEELVFMEHQLEVMEEEITNDTDGKWNMVCVILEDE